MENREILFRGIRKDDREWVEGVPIESNMNGEGYETFMYVDYTVPNAISLIVGKGHFGRCIEVHPETVGQFTGALDIDKNEIFQHSIVLDKSTQRKFKVVRSMFFAEFVMEDLETGEHVPISFQISPIRFQIIGTIHDHLLEANNE